MAAMGTPSTSAGRVHARKSVSSVRRSADSCISPAMAAGDQVDDGRGAEDHDDADHHGAGPAQVDLPEHPDDAGDDHRKHRETPHNPGVEQVDDVLNEAAQVPADSA